MELVTLSENEQELPRADPRRVAARLFAPSARVESLRGSTALVELARLTTLPGIVELVAFPELADEDGFPRGCAAAFEPAAGVIVPAGAGIDVHCGVRLLAVRGVRVKKAREHRGELAKALADAIPSGPGRVGTIALKAHELDQVARLGARWAVERKLGVEQDLDCAEDGGRVAWAEPKGVARVRNRFSAVSLSARAELSSRRGLKAVTQRQ